MDAFVSAGPTIIGIIPPDNSIYFTRRMKIDPPGLLSKRTAPLSLLQLISSTSNPEK